MLNIEKALVIITAIKLGREKGAEARRRYGVSMAMNIESSAIADLCPHAEFTGTFWNGNGEPQMEGLYPLNITTPARNVRVSFFDRLKGPLVLDHADVSDISVTPLRQGRGRVEFKLTGAFENGDSSTADRLWRMLGTPTETTIEARQFEISASRVSRGSRPGTPATTTRAPR